MAVGSTCRSAPTTHARSSCIATPGAARAVKTGCGGGHRRTWNVRLQCMTPVLGLIFDLRQLPVLPAGDESIPDHDSHVFAREPSGRAPLTRSHREEDRFVP